MEKELKGLKVRLSIISVFITSFLILLFGVGYLSYKFIESRNDYVQKTGYYEIELDKISINDSSDFENDDKYSFLFNNFFVVFDSSDNLLFEYVPKDTKKHSYNVSEDNALRFYKKLDEDDGYINHSYSFANGYSIYTFFYMGYSLEEYLIDISVFTAIVLLFSGGLFYLFLFFVNFFIKPIRENLKGMEYFVQVAGHELKTPISVISSSTQMMKQTKKYDPECIEDIENEIERYNNLTNSLIDLYKINTLAKKEEVKIGEIVYEVLNNQKSNIKIKNINLKIDFKNEINLKANKDYMYIMIFNLISNAIKYSDNGGQVILSINKDTLKIKDFGIGIESKEIGKIWDIFYRAKNHRDLEGHGLGLSTVKKISALYGFKINVESEKGEGTKFKISLK